MEAQFKKGLMPMCILSSIEKQELYGYELVQTIIKFFPDVSESTIYAILRRLHRNGFTSIRVDENANGQTRKYYSITDYGREYLQSNLQDWREMCRILQEFGIE